MPLLILGVLGIVGGVLALFLPETLNQELPQTLNDGENFGLNQKFFEFPCIKKYVKITNIKRFHYCYYFCFCRQTDDDDDIETRPSSETFKRASSGRLSTRASFRGEVRSSIIHRASARSRKSVIVPENEIV